MHTDHWEAVITFRLGGGARVGGKILIRLSKIQQILGDGMAIWFTEQFPELGEVFGMSNYWKGLGLFIDSFDNDGKVNRI